ncbi:hypothetical protein C8R46DRAFT_1210104 [Mycena filopes]|nr:hypothetical protein C8R46DRAFT_1210104 [Mycena filopes]
MATTTTTPVDLRTRNPHHTHLDLTLAAVVKDPTGHLDYKDVDREEPALIVDLDLPSTLSLAKIANHSQIKARRNEALTKGLKVIDKAHLLNATLATQRLFRAVFPDELDLLNNIFTRAQKREWLLTGSGYRLIIDDYEVLLRVLYNRRLIAEDSFRLVGRRLPKMPSWGNDDDLEEYWSLNDFEILAVCFRADVEHFLYRLDKFHDFSTQKPRDSRHEVMEIAEDLPYLTIETQHTSNLFLNLQDSNPLELPRFALRI